MQLNTEQMEEIKKNLNYLVSDFEQLLDRSWAPDTHSINNSIDTVNEVAKVIGLTLKENTDESTTD